ncbi:hypothetical protein [Rhizobium sp. SL86]|uniref:hypothetical protein n=1 Tax=Rhizobium sp. SL86 TaxID=2995148 RepID=UPI0022737DBE|nr:hypothetical protein [Rhizobium sp. SL86]MCY1668612.1 hypothetical protein [Rhizobium sp. SL86]
MANSSKTVFGRSEKSIAAMAVAERLGIPTGDVLTALREDWTQKGTPYVKRKMKGILQVAELMGLSGVVKAKDIAIARGPTREWTEDTVTSERLRSILGAKAYYLLIEHHGGTRLYVPQNVDGSEILRALDYDDALKLSKLYGGSCIRVPLDRECLAANYFEQGLTVRQVAIRLRVTETGADKLKARIIRRLG